MLVPSSLSGRPSLRVGLGSLLLTTLVAAAACKPNNPPPETTANPPADDSETPDAPPTAERHPAVPADHPLHDRFEGTSFANACSADGDCKKGGCSSEVCSAEEGVITTCDVPLVSLPGGTECGCVEGQCQWWNESGDTLPPADTPPGTDCGGQPCAPPNECIEYYGIAGPSGPKFFACAIRCQPPKRSCPDGMHCVTIADGPGDVCQ